MGQLNLRLDDTLVRRFEATAAALGRSLRDAGAEALAMWTVRHARAARAIIGDEAAESAPIETASGASTKPALAPSGASANDGPRGYIVPAPGQRTADEILLEAAEHARKS